MMIMQSMITAGAELHFHEQEIVSIFHETNVSGAEEQFAELAFFGAYTIRCFSNLGVNQTTDNLAESLFACARIIAGLTPDTDPSLLLELKPKVIPYPGYAGRKQFINFFLLSPAQFRFDHTPKGFGWLATGVGYYVPVSVLALLRYFASRRLDDTSYLQTLAAVASACGNLQVNRQIDLNNHLLLLMGLVKFVMEAHTPRWLRP
jgi:hypothetical protein